MLLGRQFVFIHGTSCRPAAEFPIQPLLEFSICIYN